MKVVLYIAALLSISITAFGQRYPFFNFSIEHGLIQTQATCLAQGAAGQLWIGTLGGLSSYDGYSFDKYTIRQGLAHNKINALATTQDGKIWIGSENGLTVFDGLSFKKVPIKSNKEAVHVGVTQLALAEDNQVWILHNKQLFKSMRNHASPLAFDNNQYVSGIASVNKDELYFIKNKTAALFRYRNNRVDSITIPDFNGILYKIGCLNEETLYLISTHSLWLIKEGVVTQWNKPLLQKLQQQQRFILQLLEMPNGAIWLSLAEGGAAKLEQEELTFFTKKNGFTSNIINHMMLDNEGNMWLASDGEGIYRYKDNAVIIWDESVGLPSNQVMSMAQGGQGEIWLGTYYAGLHYGSGSNYNQLQLPGVNSKVIACLLYDNGGMWIGAQSGLMHYRNGSFRNYSAEDLQLSPSPITALYKGDEDRLFVGTQNGCAMLQGGKFKTITMVNRVQDFVQIGPDSVLIASSNNILLFHKGQVKPWLTGQALDAAQPECFAYRAGELWVGTADQGLFFYNFKDKSLRNFTSDNQLKSDFIYSVLIDSLHQIWVGTGAGISRLKRNKSGGYSALSFDKQHAVPEVECNHNSIMEAADGRIWVGTTKGIFCFDKRAQFKSPPLSNLTLTQVLLNGEAIKNPDYFTKVHGIHQLPVGLRLPPRSNNLRFQYQALSLSGTRHILYRYHLEGLRDTWSEWSAGHSINYPSLPSGNFVLHLQAKGINDTTILSYAFPFEIITPLHQRTWFKWALILAGTLILMSIQYAFTLRRRRRAKELEKITKNEQRKIRQRTAEDFHDEVGNKITRISVLTSVLRKSWRDADESQIKLLDHITDSTRQLYNGTRDILWSLDPAHDNLYELINRIAFLGEETFADVNIKFSLHGQNNTWQKNKISILQSRNLLMICKEAFTNILKYAQAGAVKVVVQHAMGEGVELQIIDNGKGFDPHEIKQGNGLKNIATRTARIGADFSIKSNEFGTRISVLLPKKVFLNP